MRDGSLQGRDGSLQGIEAVERQQRMLAEGHREALVLDRQHG